MVKFEKPSDKSQPDKSSGRTLEEVHDNTPLLRGTKLRLSYKDGSVIQTATVTGKWHWRALSFGKISAGFENFNDWEVEILESPAPLPFEDGLYINEKEDVVIRLYDMKEKQVIHLLNSPLKGKYYRAEIDWLEETGPWRTLHIGELIESTR